MADPVIRLAQPGDAEIIARLWLELVASHHALDPALPEAAPQSAEFYARAVQARLRHPATRVLVAEHEGALVGYVLASHADTASSLFAQGGRGLIADLFVCPDYRRRGVGRRLVAAITDWFAACGLTAFEWHVAACNPEAVAFWNAIGGRALTVRMWATVPEEAS